MPTQTAVISGLLHKLLIYGSVDIVKWCNEPQCQADYATRILCDVVKICGIPHSSHAVTISRITGC